MKCREASIRISLHVGEDLPVSEVPALESHLEACTLCEAEYESYASARDALFLLKDEFSGSTSLWEGIVDQLEESSTSVLPFQVAALGLVVLCSRPRSLQLC